MSTLEDDLRQVFADPPGTPPNWPDASERVRAGIRRRRRRRVALAAGTVTLATLAATTIGFALMRGQAGPRPTHPTPTTIPTPSASPTAEAGAIPWRGLPPVAHEPTLSPRPAAAPCRTADLALDPIETNGAGGTLEHIIEVRNAGRSRCTLAGRPTLLKTDPASGAVSVVAVRTRTVVTPPANSAPATIDPGERAWLDLETHGSCLVGQPSIVYSGLVLQLADGGRIALRTSVDATCGVGLGEWYRPTPPPKANAWDVLTPAIQAPASVRAGDALDYVVVLTNSTGADVPLSPCPNYLESLSGVKAAGAYELNCAVPAIPAGGSLRFAMRLAIPAFVQAGTVTLTWSLDDGAGNPPQASSPLTITR